jgi:hypothetical protein
VAGVDRLKLEKEELVFTVQDEIHYVTGRIFNRGCSVGYRVDRSGSSIVFSHQVLQLSNSSSGGKLRRRTNLHSCSRARRFQYHRRTYDNVV